MRRPYRSSIRRRLMALSAAISLLTMGIAGALFVINDVHMLRGQMVRDLEVLSLVVGDNCLSALVFDVPETAEKILGTMRKEPQIRYAILHDSQGRTFARYTRDPSQPVSDPTRAEDGVHLDVSLLGIGAVEVVRELVYNLVKHARASKGAILASSSDGGLDVEVRDDGQGFRADAERPTTGASGGYGLYSIRERLAVFGGRLRVESGAQGSRVTIHVPTDAAVPAPSQADRQVSANPKLRPFNP